MTLDLAALAADPTCAMRAAWPDLLGASGFYLYGAGQVGRRILAGLRNAGLPVRGFIDNNAALHGGKVEGAYVWPFAELKPGPNDVCVVTIWRYRHDFRASAEHARRLGFSRVVHFSALATLADLPGIFPNYAVDHPAAVFGREAAADHADLMASLADEPSRALADQVLAFHALPSPDNLPPLSTQPLPFDPAAVTTYVDCGAFVGDDFAARREAFTGLKRAALIEPDPASFATLSARDFPGLAVERLNVAASDRRGSVRFAASGAWGSRITEAGEGGVEVQTLPLDDLTFDPTERVYVKMDVEGHELAVLEGARSLLAGDRAIFSVTLEHRARDLFDVPRLLGAYPHRRTYLFAHDTEFVMDLVAYSVPEGLLTA